MVVNIISVVNVVGIGTVLEDIAKQMAVTWPCPQTMKSTTKFFI